MMQVTVRSAWPCNALELGSHDPQRGRSCGNRWSSGTPSTGRVRRAAARLCRLGAGCGGFGIPVAEPAEPSEALRQALDFTGPAPVDVAVDPNESPRPGMVTHEQAEHFAQAFPAWSAAQGGHRDHPTRGPGAADACLTPGGMCFPRQARPDCPRQSLLLYK
jgi:hypothetical protein